MRSTGLRLRENLLLLGDGDLVRVDDLLRPRDMDRSCERDPLLHRLGSLVRPTKVLLVGVGPRASPSTMRLRSQARGSSEDAVGADSRELVVAELKMPSESTWESWAGDEETLSGGAENAIDDARSSTAGMRALGRSSSGPSRGAPLLPSRSSSTATGLTVASLTELEGRLSSSSGRGTFHGSSRAISGARLSSVGTLSAREVAPDASLAERGAAMSSSPGKGTFHGSATDIRGSGSLKARPLLSA